jgi:hypothetical protein
MTESLPADFAATLTGDAPPAAWPAPLAALWWLAREPGGPGSEGWERAHALVQDATGPEAAWVHAHLHRIEGDAVNARYWYGRAGRAETQGPTADEQTALIVALSDQA